MIPVTSLPSTEPVSTVPTSLFFGTYPPSSHTGIDPGIFFPLSIDSVWRGEMGGRQRRGEAAQGKLNRAASRGTLER